MPVFSVSLSARQENASWLVGEYLFSEIFTVYIFTSFFNRRHRHREELSLAVNLPTLTTILLLGPVTKMAVFTIFFRCGCKLYKTRDLQTNGTRDYPDYSSGRVDMRFVLPAVL